MHYLCSRKNWGNEACCARARLSLPHAVRCPPQGPSPLSPGRCLYDNSIATESEQALTGLYPSRCHAVLSIALSIASHVALLARLPEPAVLDSSAPSPAWITHLFNFKYTMQVQALSKSLSFRPSAIAPLNPRRPQQVLGRGAALRVTASDDEGIIPILGGAREKSFGLCMGPSE